MNMYRIVVKNIVGRALGESDQDKKFLCPQNGLIVSFTGKEVADIDHISIYSGNERQVIPHPSKEVVEFESIFEPKQAPVIIKEEELPSPIIVVSKRKRQK